MKFEQGKRYLVHEHLLSQVIEVTVIEISPNQNFVKLQFPEVTRWEKVTTWAILEEL